MGFFGLLPLVGLGGPIVGIFAGGLLGGFVGEYLYRRDLPTIDRLKMSGKVCLGIGLGSLIGNLVELVLAIVAVGIFIWNTWPAMVWG
jgi:uncharacterized protein